MLKCKMAILVGMIAVIVTALAVFAAQIQAPEDRQTANQPGSEGLIEQAQLWREREPIDMFPVDFDRTIAPLDSAQLDSFIVHVMDSLHVPGVGACVVKQGRIIWTGAYGYANIEENIEVADTTLFALASISKTFTGMALMQLWEEGLFGLDDDINDYLDSFEVHNPWFPDSAITFRMLLAHASSIKDNWNVLLLTWVWGSDSPIPLGEFLYKYFTPGEDYYSAVGNFHTGPPGTAWDYCNVAIALAGYLVEAIADSFPVYCQDSIFTPLDMYETAWFLADLDTNNIAVPYRWTGSTYSAYAHYGFPFYPAATLRSSTLQVARHLIAFMKKGVIDDVRILESATVDSMTTIQFPELAPPDCEPLCQGIIWHFRHAYGGRWLWGHIGSTYGTRTYISYCEDQQSGVIVLTNGESHDGRDLITEALYDFALQYPFIGDATGDGIIDIGDVVYLIGYLYRGGPAPDPSWTGDCNCDEVVDIGDVVYLINYLYRNGDPPSC